MKTKTKKIFLFSCCLFFVVFAILLFRASIPAQAANPTMPDITVPELKIKIPNFDFTPEEKILEKCDKDAEGNVLICYFPWIGEYIVGVYKYAVGIVGIIAAIVLMVGGVIWLTAGGNQSRVGEAQNWIKGSITGLVLLLSSYVLLFQINPALLEFKPIAISMVQELPKYEADRISGDAEEYKKMDCHNLDPNETYDFYATVYAKFNYDGSLHNRCRIGLNCECPNHDDRTTESCKKWHKYSGPCREFNPVKTPYCDHTASGKPPVEGVLAADASRFQKDGECFKFGQEVCMDGKNYTIEDRGSAIKGRRFDIWVVGKKGETDDALEKRAGSLSGVKKIKLGRCP